MKTNSQGASRTIFHETCRHYHATANSFESAQQAQQDKTPAMSTNHPNANTPSQRLITTAYMVPDAPCVTGQRVRGNCRLFPPEPPLSPSPQQNRPHLVRVFPEHFQADCLPHERYRLHRLAAHNIHILRRRRCRSCRRSRWGGPGEDDLLGKRHKDAVEGAELGTQYLEHNDGGVCVCGGGVALLLVALLGVPNHTPGDLSRCCA